MRDLITVFRNRGYEVTILKREPRRLWLHLRSDNSQKLLRLIYHSDKLDHELLASYQTALERGKVGKGYVLTFDGIKEHTTCFTLRLFKQ